MTARKVVIDTSAVLAFILPDEEPPEEVTETFDLYAKDKLDLWAPNLLKLEVANALRSSFLTGRATREKVEEHFENFLALKIFYDDPSLKKTLENSLKQNISAYDSAFLTLAGERKMPLISLDRHLQGLN